jgi:hypothetical protein
MTNLAQLVVLNSVLRLPPACQVTLVGCQAVAVEMSFTTIICVNVTFRHLLFPSTGSPKYNARQFLRLTNNSRVPISQ